MATKTLAGTLELFELAGLHRQASGALMPARSRRSLAPIGAVQGTALSASTRNGTRVGDDSSAVVIGSTGFVGSTGSPPRKAPV